MSVKMRQYVERKIAQVLLRDGIAAGYSVAIENGDSTEEELAPKTCRKKILAQMFQTDDEYLHFYREGDDPKDGSFGWVRFVYGNDGYDVISDYTVNLEHIMVGAKKMADRFD